MMSLKNDFVKWGGYWSAWRKKGRSSDCIAGVGKGKALRSRGSRLWEMWHFSLASSCNYGRTTIRPTLVFLFNQAQLLIMCTLFPLGIEGVFLPFLWYLEWLLMYHLELTHGFWEPLLYWSFYLMNHKKNAHPKLHIKTLKQRMWLDHISILSFFLFFFYE